MNTPSTDSSTPAVASAGISARAARTWDLINKSGIVMVFIILFAVLSFTVPDFISSRNIQGLLLSVTLIGSISVTMVFVLALGEVDLSVASIVAFAGVVASTLITATHSVLFGFLLKKTVFGKNVLAFGGNSEAALLAGLPVTRIKITVFVLQGLVTGFAGVMLASRMSLGDPKTSVGLELGVISACVLGGVSLTGGVATISGVLVGVLIMGFGSGRHEPPERADLLPISDSRRYSAFSGIV